MASSPMLRLFFATFGTIFLAELGDKTQLATVGFSAEASSTTARAVVFAGAALALITASGLGVLAGGLLSRALPASYLERGAGVLFVVLGLYMVFGRGG